MLLLTKIKNRAALNFRFLYRFATYCFHTENLPECQLLVAVQTRIRKAFPLVKYQVENCYVQTYNFQFDLFNGSYVISSE